MIKLNFDKIRPLFGGHFSQSQVDGLNSIISAINDFGVQNKSFAAYMLATAFHETAQTMQPIEEIGKGKGHNYSIPDKETGKAYYGRGYVQLTWKANYSTFKGLLNIDLVNRPELALEPHTAAEIMIIGMIKGKFTGKSLSDYITPNKTDFVNCRRVINGTDRAKDIAGYADKFLLALS